MNHVTLQAELEEVMLSELQRQRRRLGELSTDQERAIKALLRSTIKRIVPPAQLSGTGPLDERQRQTINIWRNAFTHFG